MKLKKDNKKETPGYPKMDEHHSKTFGWKGALIVAGCSLAAASCSHKKSETESKTGAGKTNRTNPVNNTTNPKVMKSPLPNVMKNPRPQVDGGIRRVAPPMPSVVKPDCDHGNVKDHKGCPNFTKHHPGKHDVKNDKHPPKDGMKPVVLPPPVKPVKPRLGGKPRAIAPPKTK